MAPSPAHEGLHARSVGVFLQAAPLKDAQTYAASAPYGNPPLAFSFEHTSGRIAVMLQAKARQQRAVEFVLSLRESCARRPDIQLRIIQAPA